MPRDIIVCVKQVPHPDYLSKVSIDPDRGTINREGIPAVINPPDRNAVEEALGIRDRYSGRVVVITMGPPQARKTLEETLAMGADKAVHLCDLALAGADTLATARALAYGIHKIGRYDLILCGDATVDSGTGQVSIQLAEFLNVPCITDAEELAFENEQSVVVKRMWERGHVKIKTRLPAVIAVTAKINQPRLPTVMEIMASTQKEIQKWSASDINADVNCVGLDGSPTQVYEMSEFHAGRQGEILQGSAEEVVSQAVERLLKMEIL